MKIKHRLGEYEVVAGDLAQALAVEHDAYIISDEHVLAHWRGVCGQKPVYAIKPGETSKDLESYRQCLSWLACQKASRKSTLIALGGGVVGDLAGFVAATYMRGIRLIQAPTTLLAMVDSAVGGKVAIDLPEGKNLVGAFYPPARVILDYRTLDTLPKREFNNGAAEIWKYGAILDITLLEDLEAKPLGPGDARVPQLVNKCVGLKAQIVEADEYETKGARAVLNFGHTVGHAIERNTGYGSVLHGEAIAVGMVVEAAVGERLGISPRGAVARLKSGLESQGLPTSIQNLHAAPLVEAMRLDKKATDGRLAFALLTGWGSCKLVPDVPESVVLECLREHL